MKVLSARFVKSAMQPGDYPRMRRPQVAFVGRSNVGKSSLLNVLLGRKGLAKTSNTPGKTQTINFFEVNEAFHFVDLPGYGYAKVSKKLKDEWNRRMAEYLQSEERLVLVAALVDSRHEPSPKDIEMLDLLEEAEVPTLVVATKVDKLKKGERKKNLARIRQTLGLDEDAAVLPFSSVTKEGVRPLWSIIDEVLQSAPALGE